MQVDMPRRNSEVGPRDLRTNSDGSPEMALKIIEGWNHLKKREGTIIQWRLVCCTLLRSRQQERSAAIQNLEKRGREQ